MTASFRISFRTLAEEFGVVKRLWDKPKGVRFQILKYLEWKCFLGLGWALDEAWPKPVSCLACLFGAFAFVSP